MNMNKGLFIAAILLVGCVRAEAEASNYKERDDRRARRSEHQRMPHAEASAQRLTTQERKKLMSRWHEFLASQDEHDVALGRYADLYLVPAWPVHARWFEHLHQLGINFLYSYATDALSSSGSASDDVTSVAFGQSTIKLSDMLAVASVTQAGRVIFRDEFESKLFAGGAAAAAGFNDAAVIKLDGLDAPAGGGAGDYTVRSDNYFGYTHDLLIKLNGRQERFGVVLDLTRYILPDRLSIGVHLPVMYVKHGLDFTIDTADTFAKGTPAGGGVNVGAYGPATGLANLFLRRYGADPVRFVKDVLLQKGFRELGGSATGLGDLSLFLAGQIDAPEVERVIVGARVQIPTGKKATQSKLWAPELGNGGFTEMSIYAATCFQHNRWLNPHVMASLGASAPAHVNRRVPRYFSVTNNRGAPMQLNVLLGDHPLAMAERVQVANGNTVSGWDTAVNGFGDTISSVKVTRGVEVKLRLGNVFQDVFAKRGTADVYYDMRAKTKDSVSGLSREMYNLDAVRKNTNQTEHRIGFEYSYQPNHETRLRTGVVYTFAGTNVAKTLEWNTTINYSF